MNKKGFSLIEMAIVMVIFGLVLASASSILTLFVNRGGAEKTRQMITANKNALASYVQANKELPEEGGFTAAVSYPLDGYNKDFFYYADPILDKTMSVWNLGGVHFEDTDTVCGSTYTNTEVWICGNSDCTSGNTKIKNVAFVIVSGSENKNIQTNVALNIIKVYPQGTNAVDDYTDDLNRTEQYDDIVDWMSLDELRSKVGCEGEAIKFTSQIMPAAKKGTAYAFNFYIEGGVPFARDYSGDYKPQYRWNVSSEASNDNQALETAGLTFKVVADGSETALATNVSKTTSFANTTYQGEYLRVSGNAASFPNAQYRIEILVRDMALNVKDETPYKKIFILNAEQ